MTSKSESARLTANHIHDLIKTEVQEEAADFLYGLADLYLSKQDYEFFDELMWKLDPERLGSSLCRSVLSLTNRDKDKFNKRWLFYDCAFEFISKQQGEEKAKRLIGHLE